MKKKIFSLAVILMAVVAVSCGKKADEAQVSAPASGNYYYATFAEAKVAAEASGKSMVLDFYTDW